MNSKKLKIISDAIRKNHDEKVTAKIRLMATLSQLNGDKKAIINLFKKWIIEAKEIIEEIKNENRDFLKEDFNINANSNDTLLFEDGAKSYLNISIIRGGNKLKTFAELIFMSNQITGIIDCTMNFTGVIGKGKKEFKEHYRKLNKSTLEDTIAKFLLIYYDKRFENERK